MRTSSSAQTGSSAAYFIPDLNRSSLQAGNLRQMVASPGKPIQNHSVKQIGSSSVQKQCQPTEQPNPSLMPTSKFCGQLKRSNSEKEEPSLIKKLQLHLTARNHPNHRSPSKESLKAPKQHQKHKDLVTTILQYKKTSSKIVHANSRQSALQLISSILIRR